MTEKMNLQTIAASNGIASDKAFRAVVPPIYLSSTFAFEGFQRAGTYDYSRTANPTRDILADTIAKLEGGAGSVITATGMAAVDLVLSRLGSDDLVIAPHDCYGGTYRLLAARRAKLQFEVAFIDQNSDAAWAGALDSRPALVLIETPSNPMMRIVDIAAVSDRAKSAGAMIAVDNTFLSPALQRPISLGADFVIHSTTKYLNGHSDVIGGAVVCANKAHVDELASWANITGVTGSPFDAHLTLRGLRTLFPRIERQQQTAGVIAEFLQRHDLVTAVHYPGLRNHAGHDIAKKQQHGFGAMLSFEIAGGEGAVRKFVDTLRVFTLAESLGGVESLVAHPTTMTHAGMSREARHRAGINDNLLRLSIGLESEIDLLDDLARGFAACGG
ncbi:MAG: cystathionine gamma-synthase [Pseudorhodoplanes sp.]|jgi:cystathionine gamma-synthase|nr:cystathionine gamma-synthase [Pseudorhodoplanes sp.]